MAVVASNVAVEELIKPWAASRRLVFHHNAATGSGAVLSGCGRYRVLLWRRTDPDVPFLGMGMLNPSTADHERNDNTITRCITRATGMGLAGPLVWNLFDLRTKDPNMLKASSAPLSEHNNAAIELALGLSEFTIAAWGNDGRHLDRQTEVLQLCRENASNLHCLRVTNKGCPWHPLYIANDIGPQRWNYQH